MFTLFYGSEVMINNCPLSGSNLMTWNLKAKNSFQWYDPNVEGHKLTG